MYLIGQFLHSLDNKNRVAIPAKLRKNINPAANNTIVMTQGTAKCIVLYPYDQWESQEKKLTELNKFNPEHARFLRTLLRYATDDTLDGQSRITIPNNLLRYAEIEKDVLILGMLDQIEIWNPSVYDEYLKQSEETYGEIASKVMGV